MKDRNMEDSAHSKPVELSQELRRFFNGQGRLTTWPPSKEKDKLLILNHLITHFEIGRVYSAKEVSDLLLSYLTFNDPCIIRGALNEYHFMPRERDGSRYWRVEGDLSDEERIQKRKTSSRDW